MDQLPRLPVPLESRPAVNTVITMLGWLVWVTVFTFLFGGMYLMWAYAVERRERNTEITQANLPKCPECGWVQGVNDHCDQCQRDRKVLP